MKIRMLLVVWAVLVLSVGAAGQTAVGGNSDGAKRCQKDGWQTLARANGSSFANQGECVAYAAKGGVPKEPQSISVTTHAPASAVYNTSFTVAATAPAGPVTFSSSGACTNVGAVFTITGEKGTCTVQYDQAGDSNYNAAPQVTESVLVAAVHAATTLAAAASAGDTNIKVTSTAPFVVTALAAASNAGDTNIKVRSTDGLAVGQTLNVDAGGSAESRVIQSVGTAGAGGTGVTLTAPLASAHANGSSVTPAGQVIHIDIGAAEEDATIQSVGTPGALGSGLTLAAPLVNAHESGSPVEVAT